MIWINCHIVYFHNQYNILNYHLQILQDKFITKEVRIFNKNNKNKFINPVFEILEQKNSEFIDLVILSDFNNNLQDSIDKWLKSSPTNSSPYYYKAFNLLNNKKYKEFPYSL